MAAPEITSTKTWGGLFGPHWGGGAIWRPFRFRPPSWMTSFPGPENWEWGHPRWRPEAEGPPYCASASMGTEKAALYYLPVVNLPHQNRLCACAKPTAPKPALCLLLNRLCACGKPAAPKPALRLCLAYHSKTGFVPAPKLALCLCLTCRTKTGFAPRLNLPLQNRLCACS